jgi:hypothetical protein
LFIVNTLGERLLRKNTVVEKNLAFREWIHAVSLSRDFAAKLADLIDNWPLGLRNHV